MQELERGQLGRAGSLITAQLLASRHPLENPSTYICAYKLIRIKEQKRDLIKYQCTSQ